MITHTSDLSVIRASLITCYTPDCGACIVVTDSDPLPDSWRVVAIGRPVPHEYRYLCGACAARETVRVWMRRGDDGRWGLAT